MLLHVETLSALFREGDPLATQDPSDATRLSPLNFMIEMGSSPIVRHLLANCIHIQENS